ncbi:MAG: DUF6495 family protein [Crocinitomicaceae bacterium]|jgi:hypothetical protein
MKYRMLTGEELEVLAEELKHFLIVNGVHDEEWREMNVLDIPKAKSLVALFSDTVLQKVYEKIQYIEYRSEASCLAFKLDKERIQLISLNGKAESNIDLSTPESIHSALVNNSSQVTLFKSDKAYKKERELEIHKMIEQGCSNSTKEFWDLLCKII